MAKELDEKRETNRFRLFGVMLPSLPSLIFKFGGVVLRFRREAKKGAHIFQKELIKQGLDKKTAEELTAIYLEGSDLLKYLQYFR